MSRPPPCTTIGFSPTYLSSTTSRAKSSRSAGSVIAAPPYLMTTVLPWNSRMYGSASRSVAMSCISGRPRKYDGFSRAPAASAGTRRAHTCHQHARARRAPADTTVAAASDPPYFRGRPLADRQRAAHAQLLVVGDRVEHRVGAAAQVEAARAALPGRD